MRKLFLSLLILSITGLASAQEATLSAPVPQPAETKFQIQRIDITAAQIVVSIDVKGPGGEQIRYFNVAVPDAAHPSATVPGLVTAIDTARPTETGGVLRRLQFRVLGYLADQGLLPAAVTLVP